MALVFLRDITQISRYELKPYCIEMVTKDKTYYIACKSDEEVYEWIDEIYCVCFYLFCWMQCTDFDP